MTSQPEQYDVDVFDSNSMDWARAPDPNRSAGVCRSSHSRSTPTPGCPACFCVYDAGFINPVAYPRLRERHVRAKTGPCAPTRGIIGSGIFVWFPEGHDDVTTVATEDSDCPHAFHHEQAVQYSLHIRRMNRAEAKPSDWAGRRHACARWLR